MKYVKLFEEHDKIFGQLKNFLTDLEALLMREDVTDVEMLSWMNTKHITSVRYVRSSIEQMDRQKQMSNWKEQILKKN